MLILLGIFVAGFAAASCWLLLAVLPIPQPKPRAKHRAIVVVGGDFARSPRMQYHAVSLADCGLYDEVVCIGLDGGNQCCEEILQRTPKSSIVNSPSNGKAVIRLALVRSQSRRPSKHWLVRTAQRVVGFTWEFGKALFRALECTPHDVDVPLLIIQTPPAVPFVPLVKLLLAVQKVKHRLSAALGVARQPPPSTKLVVDWHNFGFTLLAVDRRPPPIVWLYKLAERHLCGGDINLCVSEAMRSVLVGQNSHGFQYRGATVLHDTAPAFFARSTRNHLLESVILPKVEPGFVIPQWVVNREEGIIVVSATSWTADDDYSLLVEALQIVGKARRLSTPVWLVVTGKGETRKAFEQQVVDAALPPTITVSTVYFQSFKHYATMLGAADFGISLHRSSSGWDLPMKVVDMFGCGLPVAALNYPALKELVTPECGWLFDTASELAEVFLTALDNAELLAMKQSYVSRHRTAKWDATWRRTVLPLLKAR